MILARNPTELADWIADKLRSMGSNADALARTVLSSVSRGQLEMIVEVLRLLASKAR